MIDLKATQSVCSWCIGLLDISLWLWLRTHFTIIRVYSHVDDAKRLGGRSYLSKAEYFGGGNRGWSVERQMKTAGELGFKIIVTADNQHWNGRDNDRGGEPTAMGAGIPYHGTPPTEGGYTHWLDSFLKWPEDTLGPVIAVQWGNEIPPNEKTRKWIVRFMRLNAHKVTARGWLNIVDPHQARALVDAGLGGTFQVIDPHIFGRTVAWAKRYIADLRVEFPDKLIWVCEVLSIQSNQTAAMARAILAGGATGISAFSGTTNQPFFYRGEIFFWNGRRSEPAAGCNSDSGRTERGREWDEVIEELGIGGGQPVDPPPDTKPINVDAAVRKIRREVQDGEPGFARGKWEVRGDHEFWVFIPKLPIQPTKTVSNILDDLGQPWEGE